MAGTAIRGVAAIAAVAIASCGVRTPSRIDHAALIAKQGPVEARRALELRVLDDPKDIAARLALAAIDEQVGRPSAAIEQLEAVLALGGPLGTRWRAEDRARLARLIAARGAARLARESPAALADLRRARELGATASDRDLAFARRAQAIARLRHVDAKERTAGHRMLRELAGTAAADPAWPPAKPSATQRGRYGAWLWAAGARRAAWEELAAWHDGVSAAARDPALQSAYLVARAWWSPLDAPPPPAAELTGPERCRFAGAPRCDARTIVDEDPAALAGLLVAPTPAPRTRDPDQAAAWLAITLRQALRGDASWGAAFTARVDVAAISASALPPSARATFLRLGPRDARAATSTAAPSTSSTAAPAAKSASPAPGSPIGSSTAAPATTESPTTTAGSPAAAESLLVAAGRALDGGSPTEVRAMLGALADTDDGRALLRVVEAAAASPIAAPFATAVVDQVYARIPFGLAPAVLRPLVDAYARDPEIADRLALDAIAGAVDAVAAHAALGALYEALDDPARSRAAWQAAVDASPEPALVLGLAGAVARAKDPDAALIHATTAAAASGDPAVVWIAIGRALDGVGAHVHALEAARNAIDLADAQTIAGALDTAIAASSALGRTAQAAALAAQRARVSPPTAPAAAPSSDPTDAAAALTAHRANATDATAAQLWTASRWNPRDARLRAALREALPPSDARRSTIDTELVALAADRDPDIARAALAALRP